jgi:hypothetical protein
MTFDWRRFLSLSADPKIVSPGEMLGPSISANAVAECCLFDTQRLPFACCAIDGSIRQPTGDFAAWLNALMPLGRRLTFHSLNFHIQSGDRTPQSRIGRGRPLRLSMIAAAIADIETAVLQRLLTSDALRSACQTSVLLRWNDAADAAKASLCLAAGQDDEERVRVFDGLDQIDVAHGRLAPWLGSSIALGFEATLIWPTAHEKLAFHAEQATASRPRRRHRGLPFGAAARR